MKFPRLLPSLAASAFLLLAASPAWSQADVKVILMAGQSNMDGWAYAQFLPANLQNPQPDVLFYNGSPSSGHPSSLTTLRPDSIHGSDTSFGPEITFGQAMETTSPGETYVVIKYAVGGTTLATDWNTTTGAAFAAFEATVNSGLQALTAAGYNPEIVGMLWLQGENDATSQTYANAYAANLTALINEVRTDYSSDIPFVIGGIGYVDSPYRATVQAAQANVATTISNVAYFSNDDINSAQALHFDVNQMQTIGTRYATALQSVPEPGTLLLASLGASILLLRRTRPLQA